MDDPRSQQWFLRKFEDGSVFGPITFVQLEHWAGSAQVAPHDVISTDQVAWTKAPMLPQLGMDWLVEVTSERYYGPTTLGSVQEFVRLGDIDGETFIINACDGSRCRVRDIPGLLEAAAALANEDVDLTQRGPDSPHVAGLEIKMQERIRDLEQSLDEERRAYRELEERYRELERKHNQLVDLHAHSGRTS
jgi:hypothetical protein